LIASAQTLHDAASAVRRKQQCWLQMIVCVLLVIQ